MPESTGIELTLENGNVIKAANAEEALKVAAKMIEDNSKAYRETKASLDTLQGSYNTMQQEIQSLKPKPSENGFSNDKYFQLLHEDPIGAQNYLDANRFGIPDPRNVPEYFTGMYQKVTAMEGNSLAAGFVNKHQDFPQDNASAQALTQRVQQLRSQGHPTTLDTMDMAYNQLVLEGTIKPMEAEPEREEVPPSLTGAGASMSAAEMQKVENMSNKELEAYLKSKNLL